MKVSIGKMQACSYAEYLQLHVFCCYCLLFVLFILLYNITLTNGTFIYSISLQHTCTDVSFIFISMLIQHHFKPLTDQNKRKAIESSPIDQLKVHPET